ncbi:hypothetical protein BBP40_012596 [Aspergillus hancockii]|nr:hypothetical protein BBP40_012596 [Aspergillus hancockii]
MDSHPWKKTIMQKNASAKYVRAAWKRMHAMQIDIQVNLFGRGDMYRLEMVVRFWNHSNTVLELEDIDMNIKRENSDG